MNEPPHTLDETDKQILRLIQQDARNNTNTSISERLNVAPSTIGKRLTQLEESGVIKGYHPAIDYERAGYALRVLFVCTTSITDRRHLIDQALTLPGVVEVKELMTGQDNVHIEVVGEENHDITELAAAIDDLGFSINEEILIKNTFVQPASVFVPGDTPDAS